jgi:hypothetical protein
VKAYGQDVSLPKQDHSTQKFSPRLENQAETSLRVDMRWINSSMSLDKVVDASRRGGRMSQSGSTPCADNTQVNDEGLREA